MKGDPSVAQAAAIVLAVADIGLGMSAAMSQGMKPTTSKAADPESARSFPPDTTPYVRPAIPQDRMSVPNPGPANTPLRQPDTSSGTVPEPRPK